MKYLRTAIFFVASTLILNLISTIFYYFNITSEKLNNILKTINFIIIFLSTGIYIGRRSNKKGWIEGLKVSLSIILFSILLVLLIPSINFNLNLILYYIFIILITIVGSMIGINFKITKK